MPNFVVEIGLDPALRGVERQGRPWVESACMCYPRSAYTTAIEAQDDALPFTSIANTSRRRSAARV